MGNFRKRLSENDAIYRLFAKMYRVFGRNKIKGKKGNRIKFAEAKIKRTQITILGKDSYIEIGAHSLLNGCKITIQGNHCHVKVAENTVLNGVSIWCEDDNSAVKVGKEGLMMGNVQLASTEGKTITIGDEFLFSDDISVRTGDSHSILDSQGARINPAADVTIGKHVWVGNRVVILKGVEIGSDCIVGGGSVVTKQFTDNVVIAGNPAKTVKESVGWKFERI